MQHLPDVGLGNVAVERHLAEAPRHSTAPLRISSLVPPLVALSTGPGTASTLRPWSAAWLAVMRAPLLSAASTMTTARHSPLMSRLRAGNSPASGSWPMADSVSSAPDAWTARARSACSGG